MVFREVYLVINTKWKIWPIKEFPRNDSKEYSVAVDHLKGAVDKHERLQEVADKINYQPAMVGTTHKKAQASIIVLCR
ncbi:hypothetical protein BDP81DRAFT_414700 [Colletotrichum phormii]|uniref:Uncharacterized protein n=1 Tax=Colletotrichum phormii TaxID=359342 RepID=A0AAJ0A4K4_9PEZI|nr:uncharacterized protein BDP81DRAFT_414700 [Colletotrichum phormii]KAK1656368.1 hypothetical protein BDP81DRAFT_414700 [Colletotrichum phormii]